ncbi:MAG: KEOPS complex subunit Pcc1 [Haloferacaceae archaeon]
MSGSDPPADRPHDATLSFAYDDERRARTIAASLAVERDEIDDDRSGAAVERDGAVVRVRVTAADPVALRAGCTSWTRLVAVAERVT